MKHISKYIFSFCLFLSLFLVQAQETTSANTKKVIDSTANDNISTKTERYGIRVGIDLYKLTKGLYDKNYRGIELVGDYRLTKRHYIAAELGNENKTTDDDRLSSTAKGSYIKAGFDYNMYENWLDMENIISIGMRYGFSTFSQSLNNYKIYNPNPYWNETPIINESQKYNGLSTSWIEVVAGLKVKVFDALFVGFSLQAKGLITNKKPNGFDNLYIPGFNRTYNGTFGIGFNYTVSYFIPIYKKKVSLEVVTPKN